MAILNIYKINKNIEEELLTVLNNNTEFPTKKEKKVGKNLFILYLKTKINKNNISWNWILDEFEENNLKTYSSPRAVILMKSGKNIYAFTFGSTHFIVNRYCDKNFALLFAKKLDYEQIKTTTLVMPNSKRNKTINTYIDFNSLELDSGESLVKIKSRIKEKEDFNLFKTIIEIGNSIRISTEEEKLVQIVEIIKYIEKKMKEKDKTKIPVLEEITENNIICQLNKILDNDYKYKLHFHISELDIIGIEEIFNEADEYKIIFKDNEKTVDILDENVVKKFCKECELDYEKILFDIKISVIRNGETIRDVPLRNLIEYNVDDKKCYFNEGKWYYYNNDFIDYLTDSINEIEVYYKRDCDCEKSITESEFNNEREKEGYINLDKKLNTISNNKYEVADLYKENDCICSVKIGNNSSKLSYAVDQSETVLRLLKSENKLKDYHFDKVVLWFVLKRKNHIENKMGKPDINKLKMIMLKSRIDQWKKKVRLLGFKPVIYISYKE